MMRGVRVIALASLLAACAADTPPLLASDIVVTRAVPGAETSAAYLTLRNTTRETITISRVASPQFAAVEMHESRLENGVLRMRAIERLAIPPGQAVVLEPGAKHLMLTRPVAAPASVTLQFYAGDALLLSVSAPVQER